ncbi:hypothetical protein AB0B63_18515 [Micromonospora sp. NPDC049081]|uniref:hypothetical protein n=1 Tax=Micromonospora sp. NPDC049081 TaxID=3155150 RepID=UPI0033F8F14F
MDTNTLAYQERFVLTDDENTYPDGTVFACNVCDTPVDDRPCPQHAPTEVPGLRLVDCKAEPRHLLWVHDRDDYGTPCYLCAYIEQAEQERQARQCRHWGWRSWKAIWWLSLKLYALGVSKGGSITRGDGHDGCVTFGRLTGNRSYILGVSRDVWRCWLSGHRRGEPVGFGFCGKCVPWPCCGSSREEHNTGCPEGDLAVVFDPSVPPGGFVCAVPDGTRPDGICGMPVESEPCSEHSPKRGAL